MKLYAVLILVLLIPAHSQEVQGRILIDVGHSSLDVQRILSNLARELQINYYNVEYTKTILYLDPYDVLVIAVPTQPFTYEELQSVYRFVDNGGGLLLLGESGVLTQENLENFNVLSQYYGIQFQKDVIVDPQNNLTLDKPYPEIPIIENFADHPVTRNVKKIFLVSGCSLVLSKKATSLGWGGLETYGDRLSETFGYRGGSYDPGYERRGKDLVVMAASESGRGRVIALGDTSLFRGTSTAGQPWQQDPLEYLDNKKLAFNIFNWLSLKIKMSSVSDMVSKAQELIEEGRFSEARDILELARSLSLQTEDFAATRQVALLMTKADKGVEADTLMEEGKRFLADFNCQEASKSFEKALSIYESIQDKKKAEECLTLLSECGNTEALLEKADLLFKEGAEFFRQKRYAGAVRKVEEAKEIYQRLGNAEGVGKCDSLLRDIENAQRTTTEEEAVRRNRWILAAILVVTTFLIAVLYLWRRSRPYSPENQ